MSAKILKHKYIKQYQQDLGRDRSISSTGAQKIAAQDFAGSRDHAAYHAVDPAQAADEQVGAHNANSM